MDIKEMRSKFPDRGDLLDIHRKKKTYLFWDTISASGAGKSYLHQDDVMDYINENYADMEVVQIEFFYGSAPPLIVTARIWLREYEPAQL